MRALTLATCLALSCCSEQVELFPRTLCADGGLPSTPCCVAAPSADGTVHPCGCRLVCRSDSDCTNGHCDPATGLCGASYGTCMTAADCAGPNSPAHQWLCTSSTKGI